MSGYLLDITVALLFLTIFVQSSDLVKKQVALYLFCFVLFVVASELISGKQFSSKSGTFDTDFNQLKSVVYLFSLTFFVLTARVQDLGEFTIAPYRNSVAISAILSLPIVLSATTYLAQNGIRLSGEFVEHAGDRNVLFDYVFVYTVCCLVVMRGSKCLAFGAGLMAFAHLLSAERLRAFVYVMALLILFYRLQNKRYQSALILVSGFVLATFIGLVRVGDLELNDSYNVTHFGSVTVSSLYLMDESIDFDVVQRLRFLVGTIAANLVPSSFLPESFNIRAYIFSAQSIPGGGWLPVFSFAIGGNFLVVATAAVLALVYRSLIGGGGSKAGGALQLAKYAALVIFIATVPRWLMYTPYQVLKMPLYGFIGTWVLAHYIQTLVKRRPIEQS